MNPPKEPFQDYQLWSQLADRVIQGINAKPNQDTWITLYAFCSWIKEHHLDPRHSSAEVLVDSFLKQTRGGS